LVEKSNNWQKTANNGLYTRCYWKAKHFKTGYSSTSTTPNRVFL
jgi:hypothetical protein